MYSRPSHSPDQNCLIESVSIEPASTGAAAAAVSTTTTTSTTTTNAQQASTSTSVSSDNNGNVTSQNIASASQEGSLLVNRERQLILNGPLSLQVQFEISSSLSELESIQRYVRGLQQWNPKCLYTEIRELLKYDSNEEIWRNVYDDSVKVDYSQQENLMRQIQSPSTLGAATSNNNSTTSSSLKPSSAASLHHNIFYMGRPQLDEDFNIVLPLQLHYQTPMENSIGSSTTHANRDASLIGHYRLELRFFQYGGDTASVFLPFSITEHSLNQILHTANSSSSPRQLSNNEQQPTTTQPDDSLTDSSASSTTSSSSGSKIVRSIITTLNSSNHFVHTIQNIHSQNWTKVQFNRVNHVHFDTSKHASNTNPGLTTLSAEGNTNINHTSTRHKFSSAVNLPLTTLKKSLESIASRKFSKSSLNSKKSVILFVIGNGLDESKLPKGRVTVLRPRRIVDRLTPAQTTAIENQTRIVQSLLTNAPFCPMIFYDLNNGRTVTTRDIQYALHFVHERARQKLSTSNVIVLCTWTFRLHQRLEALDNLFSLVCGLPNVLFVSSAGNDGEDLEHSVVYPAICDPVLAVGSLNPMIGANSRSALTQPNPSNTAQNAPLFQLNADSNRGRPVNFFVRADSTSDAAIYSSVVLALMWLLDTSNGQQELRNLFLQEACSSEVCAATQRHILALTNSNTAIRRLMGEQDEEQIGGILIESDSSDDESLEQEEAQVRIEGGGVSLESVDNDSDSEEQNLVDAGTDVHLKQQREHLLKLFGISVNRVEDPSSNLIRTIHQYLNSLIRRLRHVPNSMLSEFDASLDVLSSDVVNGEDIDKDVQKLLMRGNMNRVHVHGSSTSGKTVRLQRLIVRVCEACLERSTLGASTATYSSLLNTEDENPSLPIPFFISLAGISRRENILDFIKANLSSVQKFLWEHSTNRLLVIDDFDESFEMVRDLRRLLALQSQPDEQMKIIVASTCSIINRQLASTFHEINVVPLSIDASMSTNELQLLLFGISNQRQAPLSEAAVRSYVTWCKQHAPLLLQNLTRFSAVISTEIYRKLQKLPERKNSGLISKLLQHLSSSSQRYHSVVEDLCFEFIESLSESDLAGIDFSISDATLARKKKLLQRFIMPVLSLFAFHILQSPSQSFSQISDPFNQKKYDFVFQTIAQNISKFKLFCAIPGSHVRRRRAGSSQDSLLCQYRFTDPFFATILAAHYLQSMFADFKTRKKDLQLFYNEFYRQLHDPLFYDCLLYLKSDADFRKFLSQCGLDQILLQRVLLDSLGDETAVVDDGSSTGATVGSTISAGAEHTDDQFDYSMDTMSVSSHTTSFSQASSPSAVTTSQHSPKRFSPSEIISILDSSMSSVEQKREAILNIISNCHLYDMYQSEKTVNRLITLLSTEKNSVTQQYLLKAICKLATQCPDSAIQVIVRSIQVIASDPECEIRCFAICQLKNFTRCADLEQIIHFLLELFKRETSRQLKLTILDTISELAANGHIQDFKSIWFELWSLEENTSEERRQSTENAQIRVALLKSMSVLVSTPQHFGSVMQRLVQMLRTQSISFVDALTVLRELASRTFTFDDVYTIIRLIERYTDNNQLNASRIGVLSSSVEDSEEIEVIKLEIMGNLLRVIETLQEEAQRVEKSQTPSDDSLQESLIQDLFTALKNGSVHAAQKAVDVIEQLPDSFSQRVNILQRTAECVASGSSGTQSVLTKRLIRLFEKFMDENMSSESFWSCFVKLGYIVSDYDVDETAHHVILHIAQKRSLKEVRLMLDELVRLSHDQSVSDGELSVAESMRTLIHKLYHYLVGHENGGRLSSSLME